jgi:VCBS repeat-containing protein
MAGTPLTVAAAGGVLANDFDPEGDPFTAELLTAAANGPVALAANGSFTYTPNAGFTGTDNFVYQVTGGDSATVTITVGSPLPEAGLVAQFETGASVTLALGSTVTGWIDSSGKGNHLTAAGNPTLVAGATPTGAAAIAFDGTGDLLQRVNATAALQGLPKGGADRTIFLVVDYIDPEGVSAGFVYGDGAKNETFGLMADKNGNLGIQGYGGANDFSSGQNGVAGGFLVQSVVLDDNVTSHYLNGTLIDSDPHVFKTDLRKLTIGGEIGGAGEARLEVAAALVYDRALDATERSQVENYLQSKYIDGDLFA